MRKPFVNGVYCTELIGITVVTQLSRHSFKKRKIIALVAVIRVIVAVEFDLVEGGCPKPKLFI